MRKKTGITAWTLTVMFAAITVFTACQETEPKTDVGLQLWSVRNDMAGDPVATIQQVGKMGYDYVESAGYSDRQIYGMEPEAFKSLVEESGMRYLGAHVGMQIPDSGDWQSLMPWWDKCIAAHKAAGVEYIVQPSMGKAAHESIEGLSMYCDYFNAIGEKCNDAGVRFGFHNHAGEFKELEGEVMYDYMMAHTDPEKVMFQLDVYWIIEGGKDVAEYLEKYKGRYGSIHIKDHKELGESGKIDFSPILELAQEVGADYYVVEVEKYNFEPLESVNKSLEYLRNIGFSD